MSEVKEKPTRRATKKQPLVVEAFDVIVDATSKYLRAIFPPIFKLRQESKKKT